MPNKKARTESGLGERVKLYGNINGNLDRNIGAHLKYI